MLFYILLALSVIFAAASDSNETVTQTTPVENSNETTTESSLVEDTTEPEYYNDLQPFPNKWLEVPLDHFNLFDNRTWKMRYFINDMLFRKGNPIFIEVGGEWTIDGSALLLGQVYKLAKKHHGLLIETEHRYYGKSLPFKNFTTKNLEYLQIEQALEDLAYFIDHLKNSKPEYADSKVILHGCSYPGMLVTWMRLRFPHLVYASYASSAPLGVGLDYPEYFEIVNDVYANVSIKCIGTIREGFHRAASLMKTPGGRRIVRNALRGWNCIDPDEMNSLELLKTMMNVVNVQSDPHKYEELSCLMLSLDSDDTDSFRRLVNFIKLKSKDQGSCSSDDEDTDADQEETESANDDEVINGKSWSYQTCTEMGTFQTLNRENSHHPFALDATLEESVEECVSDFDNRVTEKVLRSGVERVTRRYGGLKPQVTRVVTVQGTKDPWRRLAVLEDYTPDAPVLIARGGHCIDIDESDDITPDIVEIKDKARDYISKWIDENRSY